MKLDLNKPVLGLDRKPIADLTLGQILGSYLSEIDKGDSIRMLKLGFELYDNQIVDVELEQLTEIRELLAAKDCQMKNLYSGQIRSAILKAINAEASE